jgi:hypothetical protein
MSRPAGSLNRITRLLKEGLVQAAIDSELGQGSLNTYLKNFANKYETEFFAALVGKLIPKQTLVQSDATIDIGVTYSSLQQVRDAMLESGMAPSIVAAIESQLPLTSNEKQIEHTEEPHDDEEQTNNERE